MARWGMVIDLGRCTGCRACEVACKAENNVPIADDQVTREGRAISWMQVLVEPVHGTNSGAVRYIPRPCMHCDNPPCTKVCPVNATQKAPDGIVGQIYARCIGCRYCANACPYTIKFVNWFEPEWPAEMRSGHNPDVSLRSNGVVEKCTFCHHRLLRARERAKAQGRPLADGDYTTACQDACPTKAIAFGDLDDPASAVAALARGQRAYRLLEDLGTQPKVYYLREGEWHVRRRE
jgi:molybdopterin-containing oxidoreductase family iron-sulfur binding subunit